MLAPRNRVVFDGNEQQLTAYSYRCQRVFANGDTTTNGTTEQRTSEPTDTPPEEGRGDVRERLLRAAAELLARGGRATARRT